MGLFKTLAGKLFAYSDGTFDRAAMGSLDAYTGPNGVTSPAQAGFRAIDANGNAIFDSMGLIAVMNVLFDSITTNTSLNVATANNSTFSIVPGTGADFSLTRKLSVLFVASIIGRATTTGAGVFAYGKVFVDGQAYGSTQGGVTAIFDSAMGGYVPNVVMFHLPLSAAAHRADVRIATDDANTHWLQYTTRLTAYVLGA